MKRKSYLAAVLSSCSVLLVAAHLAGVPAYGQAVFADLHGVTRYAQGAPLAEAQVIVHSVDGSIDLTVVSGADGSFVVKDLKPGNYQLTAMKDGFASSSVTAVKVATRQTLGVDMVLGPSSSPSLDTDASQQSAAQVSKAPIPASNPLAEQGPTSAPVASGGLLRNFPRTTNRDAWKLGNPAQLHAQTELASLRKTSQPSLEGSARVANATSGESSGRSTAVSDPEISTAVARELEALKKRIDELEAELKARRAAEQPSAAPESAAKASTPAPVTARANPDAERAQTAREGLPHPLEKPAPAEPFAYADWTWLNGNARNKDTVWDSKFFTPEIRFDTNFVTSFNHPKDDSLGGSTEIFRSNEVQVEQISFGGDFHWQNVRGRVLTLGGMFGVTTPRNDASVGRGQWDLRGAYKYFAEAYGGYHFNVNHGLNIDAGIFVSYIGLFSYYNFDNWAYQPSYVSSNTPWFFNGVRIQWFPTDKLKIEPWIINGWQSYGRFGNRPGLGGQILWRPKPWLSMVFNNYGMGEDTLNFSNPPLGRSRIHTDDSIEIKYYDNPSKTLDKMAFSLTGDLGCEYGGGVSCLGNRKGGPKQSFAGWMAYNRFWFKKDIFGLTLGYGVLDNPGRYLTLLPPINGADAVSGSPYFTANPGDPYKAWDTLATFDWMPKQYITFRWEYGYRHSNQPYWSGRGGITPPGGNTGAPGSYVCTNGSSSVASSFAPSGSGFAVDNSGGAVQASCAAVGMNAWQPDLRKNEPSLRLAIMVKF